MVINASHNLVAYVGDDLNIDCIIASLQQDDEIVIRWLKSKTEIKSRIYSPEARVSYLEDDYDKAHCRLRITLSIKNLTYGDSGNYSCVASTEGRVTDSMLLTVTVPEKQSDYKSLIMKIGIPVSVVIILLAISITLGFFYNQHMRQVKLKQALKEYQERPLPRKGCYYT